MEASAAPRLTNRPRRGESAAESIERARSRLRSRKSTAAPGTTATREPSPHELEVLQRQAALESHLATIERKLDALIDEFNVRVDDDRPDDGADDSSEGEADEQDDGAEEDAVADPTDAAPDQGDVDDSST